MYVHYLYASHTIDHDVPTGPNGSHVNCIEPITCHTHRVTEVVETCAKKLRFPDWHPCFMLKGLFVGHIGC